MFSFFRRKKKAEPVAAPPAAPVPELRETPPAPAITPVVRRDESPEIAALRSRSAESLCGITPDMAKVEIHAILAKLFRRHNRAASSLDDRLRAEAEIMLEAIVDIRRRYFGDTV